MAEGQKVSQKCANNQNESVCETEPQNRSTMTNNGQTKNTKTIQNGRSVGGGINAASNIIDISEVYFSIAQPYEIQPLSKYFLHEWSEAEHLFKSAIDFAEEVYSEWSPCPSPSPTSIGL